MPGTPFREMLTLSDAVELLGRRLYGDTWTGTEFLYREPRKSPEEIAAERKPLESELTDLEVALRDIKSAIEKTLDREKNRQLAADRDRTEGRIAHLRTRLSLDHTLNEAVIDAYNAHARGKTTTEMLLEAIKGFNLKIQDERGRELDRTVWSNPKFRYYLDLSFIINPWGSGKPRREAVRVDRDHFQNWLANLKPFVEAARERSTDEQLREFLRQEFAAAKARPRKTKGALRAAAQAKIDGLSDRMFDRIWALEAPAESRKAGAPCKARKAG